jgi:hypothetical protein
MHRLISRFAVLGWLLVGTVSAQAGRPNVSEFGALPLVFPYTASSISTASTADAGSLSSVAVALPRMAPELAMQAYQQKSMLQGMALTSYSATTVIRASLPATSQSGEFELQRHYEAPHSLQFKAIRFIGDGFIKTNVIARLLQSEVDHVQKDDHNLTSLSPANYKFSFKGTTQLDGRAVHVFQVKPRKKRAGLFKGRIYLDAYTGSLVRAEGSVVKSPSFFVKKIEFVQDYQDVGAFTFPVHIHSEAQARLVGRTIVDIYQRDYQPVSSSPVASQQIPSL